MRKAINYDVGMFASADWPSRPDFHPVTVRRELEIIRHDLGCSAVRISGPVQQWPGVFAAWKS